MEILLKASAACITAAVIGTVIKKDNPSIAILLGAAAMGAAVYFASGAVEEVTSFMESVSETAKVEPSVVYTLLKIVLLAVVTRFVSDICNEAGMKAASTGIEFAGNTAALFTALPIIKNVCKMITDFL